LISIRALTPDDDALLEAFHRGIYWNAFAVQHEPLDVWRAALRGKLPYELSIRLVRSHDEIVGGIAYERYPRSGCGLVTYSVVAPGARRHGLGKQLQREAIADLVERGATAVFGELNDPLRVSSEPSDVAWERLLRNQRWGARVVETRYVQPALGPGLARDRTLVLIALAGAAPLPATIAGMTVRRFVHELYEVTEGGAPDPEIAIPDVVRLVTLAR
jgi:GNAT superfamily N-acetyltransferase